MELRRFYPNLLSSYSNDYNVIDARVEGTALNDYSQRREGAPGECFAALLMMRISYLSVLANMTAFQRVTKGKVLGGRDARNQACHIEQRL